MATAYHMEALRKQRVIERKNQATETFTENQPTMGMPASDMNEYNAMKSKTQYPNNSARYDNCRWGMKVPTNMNKLYQSTGDERRMSKPPRQLSQSAMIRHGLDVQRPEIPKSKSALLRSELPPQPIHFIPLVNPTRDCPNGFKKIPRDHMYEVIHPYEFLEWNQGGRFGGRLPNTSKLFPRRTNRCYNLFNLHFVHKP